MTPQLAYEYISRRMRAIGYCSDYQLRFRHFVLFPHEERTVQCGIHLFLLAGIVDDVRLESDNGVFDMNDATINELQYEHQGRMLLTNNSTTPRHIPMIQVIFKLKRYGRD